MTEADTNAKQFNPFALLLEQQDCLDARGTIYPGELMKRHARDAEKLIKDAHSKTTTDDDPTGHYALVVKTALGLLNAWAGAFSTTPEDDEGEALRRQMIGTFLAGYQAATLAHLTEEESSQRREDAINELMTQLTRQSTRKATRARVGPVEARRNALKAEWASGEHFSRDRCAHVCWERMGFRSFRSAREALHNAPDPIRKHVSAPTATR